jgi:hypothetical protein
MSARETGNFASDTKIVSLDDLRRDTREIVSYVSTAHSLFMKLYKEQEHFIKCPACGGWIDCRDLGQVFEHEGPLPHPAQDQPQ